MSVKIIAVGKKHESWVSEGIDRYSKRLQKPYDISWQLLPHSARKAAEARREESARILSKVSASDYLILLDERGRNLDSVQFARHIQDRFDVGTTVVLVIGGAYGVDDSVRKRAQLVWSLSKLVYPHQLVRLILAEQLYRAQEISAGRPYHHE